MNTEKDKLELKQRLQTITLTLHVLKSEETKADIDISSIKFIDEKLYNALKKVNVHLDHDTCVKWLTNYSDLYFLFIGLMVTSAWIESRCSNPHRSELVAYIKETCFALIPNCNQMDSSSVIKMLLFTQDKNKANLMFDAL